MSESTTPNSTRTKGTRARETSTKKAAASPPETGTATPSAEVVSVHLAATDRRAMIASAAYFRAERRRFESGHELEDWLDAEQEIDALLSARLSEPDNSASMA